MQTEIKVQRIHRLENGASLKAFAEISINDALLIKGVRVVDGREGLFVSLPQEKGKDNKWYDTIRCLNNDIRDQIADEVLAAYQQA